MDTRARADTVSAYASTAAARDIFPIIATERLRLRPFVLSDIASLLVIVNEHGVGDTVIDLPSHFTGQYARDWIATHLSDWEDRRAVHWAVSLLADDRLMGYAGLARLDLENRQSALSVWIGRGPERRSLAAEAGQVAMAFAFTMLGINRVYALQIARDAYAGRVLQSIGMRREGVLHERACKSDQYEDVQIWAGLRSEWMESLQGSNQPADSTRAAARR